MSTVVTTPEQYIAGLKAERPQMNDYEANLAAFGNMPVGHPWKHLFALQCMTMQWGPWLQLQNGQYKNYWFKRLVRFASRHRFVVACGAASSGKSFAFAAYLYTAWKSRCWCTSGIISSTSRDALQQRAWGILKKMHAFDQYKLGMRLDYKDAIVLQEDKNDKDRLLENSIMAVALPKGSEGEKAIGEIQGRKNQNVIWLADEFSHMDGNAVTVARGNLAANRSFQFFACSNKPEEGDPMYQDAEPFGAEFNQGWETPGLRDRKWWPTKLGMCVYLNGDDSPNLRAPEADEPPFPDLSRRAYRAELVRMDGMEDGPMLWRWWYAFPSKSEMHDRVLTKQILQTFGADRKVVWGNEPVCVAGLDLGLKADGDPTVIDFGQVGKEFVDDKVGNTVLAHEPDAIQLPQNMTDPKPYEQQIAKRVIDECEKRDCHTLAADVSGGGGTVILSIEKEAMDRGYTLHIIAVEFGGSPSDEEYQIGNERKPARQLFDRRVSEIWYAYRLAVQAGQIRNTDLSCNAVRELCERRVIQDEKRRFQVEKKIEMKKRLKRSPDRGDSRAILLIAARHVGLDARKSMTDEPVQRRITFGSTQWEPKGQYREQHRNRPAYAKSRSLHDIHGPEVGRKVRARHVIVRQREVTGLSPAGPPRVSADYSGQRIIVADRPNAMASQNILVVVRHRRNSGAGDFLRFKRVVHREPENHARLREQHALDGVQVLRDRPIHDALL